MKKFFAFSLLILLFAQIVLAGDCGSPYFKSIECATLNHKFTETGFVWNTGTGWLTNPTRDWNIEQTLDKNYMWTVKKYNNTTPPNTDTGQVSTDGRIGIGSAGTGDAFGVYSPFVLKDEDDPNPNHRYKMWYTGLESSINQGKIYMAVSPDGYSWTKVDNSIPAVSDDVSTNGRIGLGTTDRGDAERAYRASVIIDGNIFRMYYGGYKNEKGSIYQAVSYDRGFTWYKVDNTPQPHQTLLQQMEE